MTTFLLIRHGHTAFVGNAVAGRQQGIALNDVGLREAERLVSRLSSTPIHAIYSSPLLRARQTAEPLSQARGLPLVERERLAEIDFGTWTGQKFSDLENDLDWKRYNLLRSGSRCPGGESILDVQVRMVTELEELRSLHPDQTVALFSHGELIRSTVVHLAGIPMDLMLRIEVLPVSITSFTLAEWGVRILGINDSGRFSEA